MQAGREGSERGVVGCECLNGAWNSDKKERKYKSLGDMAWRDTACRI
jgi:hypothetical protein